jgi:hypothetical protein
MPSTLRVVFAVALAAKAASAAPPCAGDMAKSCLKPLYTKFKPKTPCVGQLDFSSGIEARICYANGFKIKALVTSPTAGTLTYLNKRDKVLLRGDIVDENGTAVTRFKKGKKRWAVRELDDDSLQVSCPNGSVETWTEAQVAVQPPSCGGYGDTECTQGTCAP